MKINKKYGFTLIELIAVIAILGMIMIIAIPKVTNRIKVNKKNTFIVNARNIIRQIEYENIQFTSFTKIPLKDLDLSEFMNNNLDADNSYAYIIDDKIYLDLKGTNQYKDFYLCNISNTKKDVQVQSTPCDNEHNLIYIDFTVDLDGGSTSQNFNTKYLSGNYLVLQIPIKPNDTFLGWELVSGNSELEQNRIKFGTESTRIKAIWGNNPEFVVNLNGGTSNQKFDSKYSGGSLIVLQQPTREGYIFKGWNLVTGNSILSGNIVTVGTTNTVIEAEWELAEFSISYELNGGEKGENAPTIGISGKSVVISNPTKLGYTFIGWDVIGTGASMTGTILTMGAQDVILVANYIVNSYTISYNLNEGSAENNPTNYTIETDTFTLNNPTKIGYTFIGWTDTEGNDLGYFITVSKGSTGDKTYIANWKINTYTISYNLNGGTKGSSAPTSGTYGSTVTVSNPTKTGYTFTGWSISGTGSSISGTSLTIGNENITLTANWKINTYTISYNLNGGTKGSSAPTSGTYGSTVTVSNPTKTGYIFKGWSISGTGSIISGTSLTIGNGNITLTAEWYKLPVLSSSYPQDNTVYTGNSVTSKIVINEQGEPNSYTYQWYKNGSLISGATSSSYKFTPTAVGNTTLYCKVKTAAGTVTSRTATIKANYFYVLKNGVFANDGSYGFRGDDSEDSITLNNGVFHIYDQSTGYAIFYTSIKYDITNKNTLYFKTTSTKANNNSGDGSTFNFGVSSSKADTDFVRKYSCPGSTSTKEKIYSVDVSDLEGSYYIKFATIRSVYANDDVYISEIYLK